MTQPERRPFGPEDQAMHYGNERRSRSLAFMDDQSAAVERRRLHHEAGAIAGAPPRFPDRRTVGAAARDTLLVARVRYLSGADGIATFEPEPATWFNPEWHDRLRTELIRLIGNHVDVSVGLVAAADPNRDPQQAFGLEGDALNEIVRVRITPKD